MELYNKFVKLFFNEWFWHAENVTWEDLQNKPNSDIYIPQPRDLWIIFPVAGLIFTARLLFERYVGILPLKNVQKQHFPITQGFLTSLRLVVTNI